MGKVLRFTAAGILAAAVAAVVPGHAQQPAGSQPQQSSTADPQGATPQAQGSAPADQQPIFRAGVNFVRVDVIVADRNGNPVGDLKPEDFEITEQGQAQTVETFKLISLDGGRVAAAQQAPRQIRTDLDEETEAARDDVRLFAIFLDDYHTRIETAIRAREQIARFIQTQLGPSDMVGLMYPLQPMDSVRMTRNHDAVIRALQEFRGRKYDYNPRNEFEQRYAYYPAETVERIRNQVSLSAVKALTIRMGGLKEGRKALILVSEGYTNMLPPQLRDPVAAMPGVGNLARNDPDAGFGALEDRAAFTANADLEMDLRNVYDTANRNNVSIYAVDPRGLATQEFGIDTNVMQNVDRQYLTSTMNTLRTLAFNTDGRAIVNSNDLVAGMRQIVRDNSAYYLLGYNSTFTATDGKFHEIKVRVKRPGVQVRARRGYWAFTAADAERATAPPKPEPPKAIETAINALNTPARSRLVRTWIGMDRGDAGKTRVTLVWEPMPRTAGAPVRADEEPARMSLTAIAPDGSPYFRGRLPDKAGTAGAATGGAVSFDAAPGKMQMRLAVESAVAEVLDSEIRELDVPDLSAGPTAIGTPEVFRARTPRDFQQLKNDVKAVPTASREFSRTERMLVRVPTYGSDAAASPLTAKLLNRAGDAIVDLPVTPSSVGRDTSRDIEVTLNTFPPGEYLVEITLAGPGEPIKELVGFRITG
ncbi:MAG: VWA domain-containing protein [Vicinamibacterales bacterium]